MPSASAFQKYLSEQLLPGEQVEYVTAGGPQWPDGPSAAKEAGKRAASSIAKSVALTAAASVVSAGTGVMVLQGQRFVWVVITNQRLLMFGKRGDRGKSSVGSLVLAGPRSALAAETKTGIFNSVTVRDAQTREELFRLRTGVRRGGSVKIAAACQGH